MLKLRERVLVGLQKLSWVAPLLARLAVGVVFMSTGWGKLHDLDKVTAFFTSLHIPAPHFQAVLVACTEFFGGLALVLGLLSRLAAIPMAVTMVVALLTAKHDDIDGLTSLFALDEFTYLLLFVIIIVGGPGKLSLDELIDRRLKKLQ